MDKKVFIMPRSKLAKKLGVSPTTAWNILKQLEKDKVLKSYFSKGVASLYITS